MAVGIVQRDAQDEVPIGFSWVRWLGPGVDIASASWEVVPTGELTLDSPTRVDGVTKVIPKGGVNGTQYEVFCLVSTTDGRKKRKSIIVDVQKG